MTASDYAAWWGAVVATLLLVWDVYKWRKSGPQLRLSVTPGMETWGNVPNSDASKTYVLVEVVNTGDRKTAITHLAGLY